MSATQESPGVAVLGESIESRVQSYDWPALAAQLDAHGHALLDALLSAQECNGLAALYEGGGDFRKHIIMARHGIFVSPCGTESAEDAPGTATPRASSSMTPHDRRSATPRAPASMTPHDRRSMSRVSRHGADLISEESS